MGIVGLGYVGLPLAVALADAGFEVVGLDIDDERVRMIAAGRSPVEGIRDADLADARLRPTSDSALLAHCDAVVICVPTPLTAEGGPDTSHIEAVVATLAQHITPGTLVVLESTSYPGTTEELVAAVLEARPGRTGEHDVCVAFSPERIDPGNPVFGIRNTPRIVAGMRTCCRDRARDLYSAVVDDVTVASGLREAELAKLLENTYRQVNIALMNEMVRFARVMKIDLYEAIRCASTKPFGFQAFRPGPGVGGHCIPIDPRLLASRVQAEAGAAFRFVELAQEINAGMPGYVVQRVAEELGGPGLAGARILLLGVAYKADVSDVRESPASDVVRLLRNAGSDVGYLDPHVPLFVVDGVEVARLTQAEPGRWDAAVLLQAHSAFEGLPMAAFDAVILDCTGTREGTRVARL